MLSQDTYLMPASELDYVYKFRCCLTSANIGFSILILLISVTAYFQHRDDLVIQIGSCDDCNSFKSQFVLLKLFGFGYTFFNPRLTTDFFQFGCGVAWIWILIRLYKDIEHREKLLPNKCIFIIQGSTATTYLLLTTVS